VADWSPERDAGDLSLLVGQIREQDICSLASADIAKGNQELSDRTEVQSHALEKLVGAMNDFQNTVIENTDHASTVSVLASAANDAAVAGAKVIEDIAWYAISESSEKISEITSLIDAIAFQTIFWRSTRR
jgi:methyl-accepting chemotaxis protein